MRPGAFAAGVLLGWLLAGALVEAGVLLAPSSDGGQVCACLVVELDQTPQCVCTSGPAEFDFRTSREGELSEPADGLALSSAGRLLAWVYCARHGDLPCVVEQRAALAQGCRP